MRGSTTLLGKTDVSGSSSMRNAARGGLIGLININSYIAVTYPTEQLCLIQVSVWVLDGGILTSEAITQGFRTRIPVLMP